MFAAAGDEPVYPDDAVEVGRIVGAWGVKGGLKVKPFSADPQALFGTKRWFLQPPAPHPGPGPKPAAKLAAPAWPRLLRIVQAREQGAHIVATAHDLDDRDAAEALSGARIFVSRASFPTPADDEFYWIDLIGLAVRNRDGLHLGTVVGLVQTGPTCVLRVQAPGASAAEVPEEAREEAAESAPKKAGGDADEERLIPFVSAYVDRVDLAGRCVHVDWQPDF
ncbi:MAG: ribosome maturation factor RimM [Burkholderiales bacterium]|nr:ribosome maturation factor RimM [Burkholderiales bacterium]